MLKNKAAKALIIGAVGAAVLGSSLVVSPAFAETPSGSSGPLYLADLGSGAIKTAGSTLAWDTELTGFPKKDDVNSRFSGTSTDTGASLFVAPVGKEKDPNGWLMYNQSGFVEGTHDVFRPDLTLDGFIGGNPSAVKAGGDFSLGVAFTSGNGQVVSSAVYTLIHVKSGSSKPDFTFDSPTESATPTNPPAGSQSGSVDISAPATSGQDGALELSVPAGAKATLGTPTLVGGLSTSTGKLGSITVKDGRVVSTPGWNLTSSVAAFTLTGGTDTIDAKQLGVKPLVSSGPATPAAGNVAGSVATSTDFASAAAGTSGTSVVDADLTFVAPAKAKAGTYTSKLTLTLVSK